MNRHKKQPRRLSGLGIQIALSILAVVLGVIFLFVPQVNAEILSLVFCIVLIASGAGAVIAFFVRGGYKGLSDYNFALGIALIILGIVGLKRRSDLAAASTVYIGFVIFTLGILMLQGMIQLTVFKSRFNIMEFIFSVLSLTASVLILMNVRAVLEKLTLFPQVALFVSGIFSLIGLVVLAFVLRKNRKEAGPGPEEIPEIRPDMAPGQDRIEYIQQGPGGNMP